MSFECFDQRKWKVIESSRPECGVDSCITFQGSAEQLTIYCGKDNTPYGKETAKYCEDTNTIDVTIDGVVYAIRLQIVFGPKEQVSGSVAGSWTAEDYIPRSQSDPNCE